MNRLQALAAQCLGFPGGPLAAAVYLPLIKEPSEAAAGGGTKNLSPKNIVALKYATIGLEALFREMELAAGVQAHSATAAESAASTTGNTTTSSGLDSNSAGSGNSTARGACALRLLLLYEVVADQQTAAIMPINALRNAALLAAATPLAAMVDVDLTPSASLAGRLLAAAGAGNAGQGSRQVAPASSRTRFKIAEELVRRSHTETSAWIIPAWDTHRRLNFTNREEVADKAVAVSADARDQLYLMWKTKKEIYPFASDVYQRGHGATDFPRWFQSDAEYGVRYQSGYEPWTKFPPYDARFRGYSWNKVVQVQYVAASGYTFRVLPDVWLVHRPHEPTASCSVCPKRQAKESPLDWHIHVEGKDVIGRAAFLGRIKKFYRTAVAEMKAGNYTPVQDVAYQHCRRVLPWWDNNQAA
ncbi:hypothetical protein GPECTOR_36g85 [Gonium pectorale]|uniref:Uncharacterized protein n=1 Tax=Gonium pectorale TaxID=33097 RepID=A0A150GC72_GONPE|nr:hypothetical protein GPECTOR_36g85 [Gonium pectorale]|eukprot:KXZ47363.1 hypothetical protein GPECTOR_36g85 [Gonium pectorale]